MKDSYKNLTLHYEILKSQENHFGYTSDRDVTWLQHFISHHMLLKFNCSIILSCWPPVELWSPWHARFGNSWSTRFNTCREQMLNLVEGNWFYYVLPRFNTCYKQVTLVIPPANSWRKQNQENRCSLHDRSATSIENIAPKVPQSTFSALNAAKKTRFTWKSTILDWDKEFRIPLGDLPSCLGRLFFRKVGRFSSFPRLW